MNFSKSEDIKQGDFFLYVLYSTLLHLSSLRFHCMSEDAGIEPRTVATSALATTSALAATRLDLIHDHGLDLIHTRARLGLIQRYY
jgi:hypothetical protein